MVPPIATAAVTLGYPLYAADFDPYSNGLLLVGGGGGQSKTGVRNEIVSLAPNARKEALINNSKTLIDTTRKQTISKIADVKLSSEEDSVTSLAIGRSTEASGIALAGINSSTEAQNAGRNEHLRSFELRYPPRKNVVPGAAETLKDQALESKHATRALGQASLFTPSPVPKKETYQRILRLSRPKQENDARLGAIATGLAPEGEIIAFDAGKKSPSTADVIRRLRLKKGEEAADVDVNETPGSGYDLAYCTDHEVYIVKISPTDTKESEPIFVYGTPHPDTFASTNVRPKFRSLRFLTQNLLLLLQNKPNRSGADLLLLQIPSPSSLGHVILRKRLNRSVQSATALSVSLLLPLNPSDNSQTVIAVAGQDNSISILTLDHRSNPPFPSLKFRHYTFIRNVHELQITSLTFSTFHLPSELSAAPPQYLKLASTSIASSVVVQTLPLTPYPLPTAKQRPSRYVLTKPGRSEATQTAFSVLISAIVIAIGAFFLQAFTEIRGGTPDYLGAKGWLGDRVHGWIARPYMFEDVMDKLSVPGVETRPMKGIQSQLGDIKKSVKDAIKNPELVEIPGVENKPFDGLESRAAEIKDSVQETMKRSGKSASSGAEKASDGVKGNVWEGMEGLKQQHEKIEEAAEHAQRQVADAARKGVAPAQEKLSLRDLLSRQASSYTESAASQDSTSGIIVRHDEANQALSADVGDADTVVRETHKRWEELDQHEREMWKGRLVDAGEWAVEEGEAVLKGVFFRNIGMAVGAAVRAEL